jgi:hypothetical protein
MKNRWFRLYSEIVDDPKMNKLTDKQFRFFISLLCLASESDSGDGVIRMSPKEILWRLRIHHHSLPQLYPPLYHLGSIEYTEDFTKIVNWNKRQFVSDDTTARVKRFRDKQKIINTKNETLHETLDVTPSDTDTDTEETYTSPEGKSGDANQPRKPVCPHNEILALYHKLLPSLPRVKEWTEARQKLLKMRWYEKPERQKLEWWRDYFKAVSKSDFLTGKVNEFQANLEWLVRPRNFIKVIEGFYLNRNGNHEPQSTYKTLQPDPEYDARHPELYGESN